MTKLRECPLCGNVKAVRTVLLWHGTYWVACDEDRGGCGASGPGRRTREKAEQAWNTRPTERAAAEAMREAAAKEVECGCPNAAEFLAAMLRGGPHWGGDRWRLCGRDPCGTEMAHWIRSLPLPGDET